MKTLAGLWKVSSPGRDEDEVVEGEGSKFDVEVVLKDGIFEETTKRQSGHVSTTARGLSSFLFLSFFLSLTLRLFNPLVYTVIVIVIALA